MAGGSVGMSISSSTTFNQNACNFPTNNGGSYTMGNLSSIVSVNSSTIYYLLGFVYSFPASGVIGQFTAVRIA